ncbi:MAG: ribonuclease, partial [Bacteroidetes bacterium]
MENKAKIFVLDTNVVLHDHRCIYHFEENDVVIPIVVLEELDRFKKGNEQINFQAREFMRELDKLSGEDLFNRGVSLGEENGTLYIESGKAFSEELVESFSEKNADNRILAIAEFIRNNNSDKDMILVSQDINLRLKAKSLGFLAQDYKTGKVRNLDKIQKGINTFEN